MKSSFDEGVWGMDQPPGPVGASNAYQTGRSQYTLHFAECSNRFPKVFEQGMGENCVKIATRKRERVDARHSKRHINPLFARTVLSGTELSRFQIDSNYVPRCDQSGEIKGYGSRAAATVQQAHSGM